MKEISLEEMFQKMHQNDFVEKEANYVNGLLENMVEISKDDKAFLKTVEESTTKSGDHYVVPLPFKKENLIMSNNRKQAMQRLIHPKRRFNKNPAFFEDYKQFMSNLSVKGYAKRLDNSPVGRMWYIPHHGVYHPSKPRKIRVAFDCSAQFAGKSLNQKLLTGPDLKLVSTIFYQIFIFQQMIALQKLRNMFFISSLKLFLFSRYSNFSIFVFPSFSPCQPLL